MTPELLKSEADNCDAQRVVSPQRRRISPLMMAMAAASSMGLTMSMASLKGGVIIVDDVKKRQDDSEPQLSRYDIEAIEKAKAKRERKPRLSVKQISDALKSPNSKLTP